MKKASIVVLEGDNFKNVSALKLLSGYLDNGDFEKYSGMLMGAGDIGESDAYYLRNKYPALLGIWPALAKIGAKIGKGIGKGIAKAVKRKREKREAAKKEASIRAAEDAKKQAGSKKNLIIVGGAVAAVAVILLMTKKGKK